MIGDLVQNLSAKLTNNNRNYLPFYLLADNLKVLILVALKNEKMKFRFMTFSILLLLIFSSISCSRNRYKVNTSKVKVIIEIKRLDQDMFSINPSEVKGKIPFFKKKYDNFLQMFSYVINIGEMTDSSWNDSFVKFCTDKLNNEVYAKTAEVYPDLKEIGEGLSDAFCHYKYYFPLKKVPRIYSCISGFNNSIIVGDSVIGIGLDRYLGADCKYYSQLGIYKYQAVKMNPWNIVPDCLYAWASSEWNFSAMNYSTDNVLAQMIHEGKLQFFVRCMLPECEENIIFGFSQDQMNFCINNEKQMWQYLVENKLLFNSEQLTKRKLIGDAPFTSYFTKESPGKSAVWIGFRIIESFMRKNPGITLDALMNNKDIQGILEKAKYDPQ